MSIWFRASNTTSTKALLTLTNTAGTDYFTLYASGAITGDPVSAFIGAQGGQYFNINTTSGYSANTWTHACYVGSSSTSHKVFINGGSSSTSSTLSSPTGLNNLGIAAFLTFSTEYFDGDLAEAAIWSAALSDSEVLSLASGMSATLIRPQNLKFYAPLIRNINDLRNGVSLTNSNSATVANHVKVYGC